MKKKLLVLLFTLASALCLSLGLAGCNFGSGAHTHEHDWSAEWNSNEGYHWHECVADGCTVSENSAKSGYAAHVDSNGDGYCDVCEYYVGTSEHTHTLTYIAAAEATCAQAGNLAYWYCTGCGKYFTDEEAENETTLSTLTVAMLNHTLTHTEAEAATCTAEGNLEYWYCTVCGKYFTDEEAENETTLSDLTVAAHHTLTHTAAVAATCTAEGNLEYWYCTVCGKYFTDEEAENETTLSDLTVAAHHTLTHTAAVAATCTAEGNLEYWYCTVCEKYFSDEAATTETTLEELTLSMIAHNYGEDGYCTMCGVHTISEGLALTLSDDETYYTVTGIGTCTDTDVVIPSEYNGLPVTAIGEGAFRNRTSLTSITIPDSVTSIGSAAFSGCSKLVEITLPFVGGSASATSASSSTLFGYIFGTSSYTGGTSTTQYYASYSSTTYYIPTSLQSVTITGGSILYGAFYGCTGLTSVTIPDSVTSIGSAFYECTSLTSVTIGSGVTSIGKYAFYDCTGLTEIYYNATECANLSWNNSAFCEAGQSGTGITVTIGANVKSIPAYLFCEYMVETYAKYAPKIVRVVFEEGSECTSISGAAFGYCKSITEVYITDIAAWCGITFYGSQANPLYYAKNLYLNGELVEGELVIPDSATSIGEYAFCYYTKLTGITLGSGVTSIDTYAFYNCTGLTSITIPDGVTSIGDYAFYNCSSLTTVYYGGSSNGWSTITIGSNNTYLTNATVYYYSEEEPTEEGNYWHYVNGVIVVWGDDE